MKIIFFANPRPHPRFHRAPPADTAAIAPSPRRARALGSRDGWRVRLLSTPARATPARDVTARHRSRSHQTPSRRVTHHDSTFDVSERRRARRRRPRRRRLSRSLVRPRRPTDRPNVRSHHTPQRFAPYSITEECARGGQRALWKIHSPRLFSPIRERSNHTPSPPSSRGGRAHAVTVEV